jgi:hypothetical protein
LTAAPPSWRRLAALGLALLPAARAPAQATAPPARAEAEAWTVALELPALLRAGTPALAQVHLTARAGHHVNLEYPASFRPDGGATVAFSGARVPLAPGDGAPCAGRPAETCRLALGLPFTPGAEPPRLSGTVTFSVCTAERCLIERVALAAGPPRAGER